MPRQIRTHAAGRTETPPARVCAARGSGGRARRRPDGGAGPHPETTDHTASMMRRQIDFNGMKHLGCDGFNLRKVVGDPQDQDQQDLQDHITLTAYIAEIKEWDNR